MRIQLVSDLHLEREPDYCPTPGDAIDLLILAGDIGSYQPGSRLAEDDFGLARFSPRGAGSRWPRVLFVPGNHEFDGLEFDLAGARLRRTCESLGIEWLDREVITIGRLRFIGTTLWSDFDAIAGSEPSLARQLKAREKAFRAADFYLRKNSSLRGGAPLLAEDLREIALDCQHWLRQALAQPFDGRTVVVTHFAPSLRSADPRYGITPGTAGFCNALDDLLPAASVWMHGHLHCHNDYRAGGAPGDPRQGCRVVANPRGYRVKGEQAAFRENLVIELD